MTIAPQPTGRNDERAVESVDLVTVTVDGIAVQVPKGALVIRVAEQMGIEIPRFCDHPLLDPVAACRMCLIEIEGMPKPQPACAIAVSDGMVVRTQRTSQIADKAQEGVMEFLLLNHPLDCPICDKGGECPLQNQAMTAGRGESRFEGTKRTFPKPINVSAQILLDRERCVSCARCTRFADQIAGDPMLELLERGAQQQVGVAEDAPFDSYFSGNTIQICPVGALTSSLYRFRSRPFDLVSTPTACEHCASGCALRTDVRRGEVTRRLAWDDPDVNEEWNCDKGRFAFRYLHEGRIESPLIREDGQLRPASWPEAIDAAARGLAAAQDRVGVLTGGRLTREDAYAYAKFARAVLHTDDIDFRSRISSDEETAFLTSHVAGRPLGPTYADLDAAPAVVLVGFEPEDESPIVFLRLRKAARTGGTKVVGVSAWNTRGLRKMQGRWVPCQPGTEAHLLQSAVHGSDEHGLAAALREPGAVVLVGERLAATPGALMAAAELAAATGCAMGWVPRRAGERGALDAGAMAGLLPGGRSLSDPRARQEVAAVWGVSPQDLPQRPGRARTADIAQAVTMVEVDPESSFNVSSNASVDVSVDVSVGVSVDRGADEGQVPEPTALIVAGVEAGDDPDGAALVAACESSAFVVSLSTHHTEVTERADVVFPVAAVAQKAGSFTDWEGRVRTFGPAIREAQSITDGRVLAMIADAMDAVFGSGEVGELRAELAALGSSPAPSQPGPGGALDPASRESGLRLASWRLLLDRGVLQEGEPHLAATARPTVAVMSPATAAAHGVADAAFVRVAGPGGSVVLPLELDEICHDTVWVPMHSQGCSILGDLGARPGDAVRVERATASMEVSA